MSDKPKDNDYTKKERQAAWYQNKKAQGKQPRMLKLDSEIKDRFTTFRKEKSLSVNDAMDHMLKKEGY